MYEPLEEDDIVSRLGGQVERARGCKFLQHREEWGKDFRDVRLGEDEQRGLDLRPQL